MNFDFLMTYIAVVNEQSFAKAGLIRHLSAPAIMHHINALEKEVGFPLLKRTNKGVFPTAEGNSFVQDAKQMIEFYHKSILKIKHQDFLTTCRSIRIGTSPLVPFSRINNNLSPFFRHRTDISVSVEFFDRDFVTMKDILHAFETVDLLILPFIHQDIETKFTCIPVGTTDICLKIPFAHELSQRSEISIRDLKNQTIMTFPDESVPVRQQFHHDLLKLNQGNTLIQPSSIHGYDAINECLKNQIIMVSLTEFAEHIPFMNTVKLSEKYTVSYGIVLSPSISKPVSLKDE